MNSGTLKVLPQVPLNSLIDLCSRDREWVISTTTPSVDVDYGAKKLLEIYKACAVSTYAVLHISTAYMLYE